MHADRNIPELARGAAISDFGRKLLCAFLAGALTMVLLGEVAKSADQAARRAAAEQGVGDHTGSVTGHAVGARSVERKKALI